MIKEFNVNLINVANLEDLLLRFNNVFDFTYIPVNTIEKKGNWNSFLDIFRSLDTESKAFIADPDRENIKGVHLVLKNYKALENINLEDKKILEKILEEMTHKKNRYDGLDFSYEIVY